MILITGAGGFVGTHLVRELVKKEKVRCFVRKSIPDISGVEICRGDMTDKQSLINSMRDVDAVIHLATAPARFSYDEMYRINVVGAKNLIEACRINKIKRVIIVSSVATLAGKRSDYGRTKHMADMLFEKSGLEFTILKPDFIYGKGNNGFDKIVNYIDHMPVVPIVGSGRNRRQPIHIDDVVLSILKCLKNRRTIGRTYILAGKQSMEFAAMIDIMMKVRGRSKMKLHIPVWAALALSYTKINPNLTKNAIRGICQNRKVDIGPMVKELGVTPVSFEEGLRKSM